MKRVAAVVLSVVAAVAASCDSPSGSNESEPGSAAVSAGCAQRDGERAAKAVLRCTEASVAFVETEVATGTGVVVALDDERYVLTNQHVVDPFDAADAIVDGERLERLPVVGIDAQSDIALLGPLTGDDLPPTLDIAEGTGLERGDEVYLVGYPGESASDDLEATIAGGIVSRIRSVPEFAKSYIQTDASISGGQSGGPLFDDKGRVVGISGSTFAEEFALALSGRDVRTAMGRIVAGAGDEYLSLPVRAGKGGATSGEVAIHDANDFQVIALPAADEDRTWKLEVDMAARPLVSVATLLDEELLAVNSDAIAIQEQLARELAQTSGDDGSDGFDQATLDQFAEVKDREKGPGRWEIPVEAGSSALVMIGLPLTDAAAKVRWQSDLPLFGLSRAVAEKKIGVGEQLDSIFAAYDTSVDALVDLREGQEVEVYARSPIGDPWVEVYEPDQRLDHITVGDTEAAGIHSIDDTDDGLYGLDARERYTVKKTGTYRFRVFSGDYTTTMIRFSVVDCDDARCKDST